MTHGTSSVRLRRLLPCLLSLLVVPIAYATDMTSDSGDALELSKPALRHPFEDQVLYFVIPDRFNNASATNDCGDFQGDCPQADEEEQVLQHGFLPSDRGYYHGGDLNGVLAKLDYLKAMGVTAIWVGPIFKNKPVQEDSTNLYGHSSAYHGYWITDFKTVDPHLGSNEDFKRLIEGSHERGIKVFMDIITNHTADVIKYEGDQYAYRNKTDHPYKSVDGEEFDDADYAYAGQADYSFPEMDLDGFPYQPTTTEIERDVKKPDWLNNPLLYHNRGNTSFSGENSLYGDFFGLDDLFTERKEVVEGMIEIYTYWIKEFKPDGFRIDTTKHINLEFWQVFGPRIVAAAKAAGIDDFFAFGEVYNSDPAFLSLFSTRGKLQSTIDFGFQAAAREFASVGGPSKALEAFFQEDDYYTDADSNAYAMPTFLGNHDMGRIGYFLQREDQQGADDAEILARAKLAHGLLYFSRGQPVIYYGDEQGFVGDGNDKLARQDMFPSQVAEYNDDSLIGSDASTADDNFDPNHPLYRTLQRYGALYQAHAALRRGAQIHRYSSDSPGIYAFSRLDRDEKVEYLVALNNGNTTQTARVATFYGANATFESLPLSEGEVVQQLSTDGDGQLGLEVPALGMVLVKATTPVPPSDEAPGIRIVQPEAGQRVGLRSASRDGQPFQQPMEVRAELDREFPAEVTFSVQVGDGPFHILGTDDNPPYRIFYRADETPEDSALNFVAVVNDLSGHLATASVEGITLGKVMPSTVLLHDKVVIHYLRADGDYGDPSTGDYWGLHLWGEALAAGVETEWTKPRPFEQGDACGRYTLIELRDDSQPVNFIVHRGDNKDGTDRDRSFSARDDAPEIWLRQDDAAVATDPPEGCPQVLQSE
jgi:glycosidase